MNVTPWKGVFGSETLRAGSAAGMMIVTRVLGAFGTLAYTVMLARMLSPDEFGLFWTLLSGAFIAAYLSTLNVGATAIREVVHSRTSGNDAVAAGFVLVSRRVLLCVTLPVVAIYVALIWWKNPTLAQDHIAVTLLSAALIPVMGWNATNTAQAVALDQALRSQVPGMLLRPLVFCIVLGCASLLGVPLSLEAAVGVYLIVAIANALLQFALLRRFFDFMTCPAPDLSGWRRWISTGLLLAPNRLLSDRLRDVLILISSVPLGATGVGQMAVALSVVSFFNFAVNAVETNFSPKISKAISRCFLDGKCAGQDPIVLHFLAFSGAIKLILLGVGSAMLWVCMPFVLTMFGPQYADSATVIWWLVLIPWASAFFGNSALVMQLFDQRFVFFCSSVLALVALPLVGIYGVPLTGLTNADALDATAAGFATTLVVLQALRWALCWRRTGCDVSAIGSLLRWKKRAIDLALQAGEKT